jgi:LmbE family N-acetylglucosaminyl deacetylase
MRIFLLCAPANAREHPTMLLRAIREGFDPSVKGTADGVWDAALNKQPQWKPRGAPIIVVSPHPDNESLGAGGLIATCARLGHSVIVVSVTDGEAAHPDWAHLGALRRREQREAARVLGGDQVAVVRAGLPDGQVREHENHLRQFLLGLVSRGSVIVAPYERDGHPDLEAVGRVCRQVATARGLALARYPLRAWQATRPESLRGVRWGTFSLTVEARQAKARAIACYRSQLQPAAREPTVPPAVLQYFERPYEAFLL